MREAQWKKVLDYLKKHHRGITSMRAFWRFRITRLSARIYDLREKGYLIHTFKEPNTFTVGTHARYVLINNEPELFI